MDFWILVKFTTLVEVYIFVGNTGRVAEKPIVEPVQRCAPLDMRGAPSSKMVVA
jgi:hypothetical protein